MVSSNCSSTSQLNKLPYVTVGDVACTCTYGYVCRVANAATRQRGNLAATAATRQRAATRLVPVLANWYWRICSRFTNATDNNGARSITVSPHSLFRRVLLLFAEQYVVWLSSERISQHSTSYRIPSASFSYSCTPSACADYCVPSPFTSCRQTCEDWQLAD